MGAFIFPRGGTGRGGGGIVHGIQTVESLLQTDSYETNAIIASRMENHFVLNNHNVTSPITRTRYVEPILY